MMYDMNKLRAFHHFGFLALRCCGGELVLRAVWSSSRHCVIVYAVVAVLVIRNGVLVSAYLFNM